MRAFGISQVGVEANMAQRAPQGGYGLGPMGDFEHDFVPLQRYRDRSEHAKELEALIKKKDTSSDAYFSEMAFIFCWASATLLFLVQDLKTSSLPGFPVDAFDICSVVYRGGTGDSPLSMAEVRTLISAGLIFVKVSMVDGSALVCLDLRRGSEKLEVRRMIRHIQLVEVNDKICRYPPRVGDRNQDIELTQANAIFRWRKLLGIYHSAERKIR